MGVLGGDTAPFTWLFPARSEPVWALKLPLCHLASLRVGCSDRVLIEQRLPVVSSWHLSSGLLAESPGQSELTGHTPRVGCVWHCNMR